MAPAGWEEQDGEEFGGGRCVCHVLCLRLFAQQVHAFALFE
jgi:hypothetical protein